MLRKLVILLVLTMVPGFWSPELLQAQVPQTLDFQGVLTDLAGDPVPDGNHPVTFRIFDVSAGGTELWSETQSVATSGGLFYAILGSSTPVALDFDRPYWLELETNGEAMDPRLELTSVGTALRARTANTLSAPDGAPDDVVMVDADGNVGMGTSTPEAALHVEGATQDPAGGMLLTQGAYNSEIFHNAEGDLVLKKRIQTNQLVLDEAGNVGIGTDAPTAKLQVEGSLRVVDGTEGDGKVLFSDALGTASWQAVALPSGSGITDAAGVPTGVSFTAALLHASTRIQAVGNFAYIVREDGGQLHLDVYDIQDVSAISSVTSVSPLENGSGTPLGSPSFGFGLQGDAALVGDGSGEVSWLDLSNPASPQINGDPVSVFPFLDHLDLFSPDVALSLKVLVSEAEVRVLSTDASTTVALTGLGADVAFSGNHAFIPNAAGNLDVVDLSMPGSAAVVHSVALGGQPISIAIAGTHAFVGNGNTGELQVVDISTPASASLVTALSVGGQPGRLRANDSFVFALDAAAGDFHVVEVTDPVDPRLVTTVALSGTPQDFDIEGGHAFVVSDAGGSSELQVLTVPTEGGFVVLYDLEGNILGYQPASVGGAAQTVDQLDLAGSTLQLSLSEDGEPPATLDLSGFLDNTDEQSLSLAGDTLSLTDGGSVDLSGYLDADNLGNHTATQNLQLSGNWLSNDGDNEGLRVDDTGNVGVGTSSPQEKLHVAGCIRMVDGNQGAGKIAISDANGTMSWQTGDLLDFGSLSTEPLIFTTLYGQPTAGVSVPDTEWTGVPNSFNQAQNIGVWQSITMEQTGLLTQIDLNHSSANPVDAGLLRFYTGQGTSGTLLAEEAITGPGGWSSYTLNTPVSVQAGSQYTIWWVDEDSSFYVKLNGTNPYPGGRLSASSGWDGSFRTFVLPRSGFLAFDPATGDVSLSEGDLFITAAGDVGIGTTTPQEKLHVEGNLRMVDGNQGAGKIPVSDANGTMTWTDPGTLGIGDDLGNHTATQNVQLSGNWLSSDGDNEGLIVSSTGNVGVGNIAPTQNRWPLSVKSTANAMLDPNDPNCMECIDVSELAVVLTRNLNENNTGIGIGFQSTSSVATMGAAIVHERTSSNSRGKLHFATKSSSSAGAEDIPVRMTLDEIGRLGLGVTSPADKLHVEGSIRMVDGNQAAGRIPVSDTNGTMTWTEHGLGNHTATQNLQLNGNWLSNDGDNEGLRVDNNGNVGIRVGSPEARFHIKGNSLGQAEGLMLEQGVYKSELFHNADGDLILRRRVGFPSLVLEHGKGVGIGTEDTDSDLHVQGSETGVGTAVTTIENKANGANANGIRIIAGQNSQTVNNRFLSFVRPDGTEIGAVRQIASNTVDFWAPSDARLKNDLGPTSKGLKTLQGIQVRDFAYKDDPEKVRAGFMAQDLYEQVPQAVSVGGEDPRQDPWMVSPAQLTPLLVQSIQDQQRLIQAQKAQIESLEARLKALEESR